MGHREKGARFHVVALSLGAVVLATLLAACATGGARSRVAGPCPSPPPCGENCSNQPFEPTDCWTTTHGPARADVIVLPTNFLYCNGGAYALCFFSGPPEPTGKRREQGDNRALPCVLNGDVANCTCQVYTSGPYFVDINSILNLGAYYQTVQACGHEGAGCANLFNCGKDGSKSGCAGQSPAPVCQYVRDQSPSDVSVSLMPKADLVSTFSFAMDADYRMGQTSCTGRYAGCMTAPCFFAGDSTPPAAGDPIQCQCPTFTGSYQVGQSGQTCPIPSSDGIDYVWSGGNAVSGGGQK